MRHKRMVATALAMSLLGAVCIVGAAEAPPRWASAEAMHRQYARDFVKASGFGPTRMMTMPSVDPRATVTLDGVRYQVAGLELIGVAKHKTPVVYDRPDLNVHNRAHASRALDDFESTAVAELIAKRSLMATGVSDGDNRRAIGALRAQPDCLGCHKTYQTGDVLGALSYRLKPLPAKTTP